MDVSTSFAWNLYVELRKEIVSTQELRSRAIELKITIVGAAIALFIANRDKLGDDRLLALPAFAAIFFDFLIGSYGFAVKRKGRYLREVLEPQLRQQFEMPADQPLWEEYLAKPEQRQLFSVIANMGLTLLALSPALFVLTRQPIKSSNIALIAVLLFLLGCVAAIYGHWDYYLMLRLSRRPHAANRTKPSESMSSDNKRKDQRRMNH